MAQPSLILHNTSALTMDAAHPRAEAVALAGNRILAVGSNAEVLALAGPETRLVDGQGATLLPGFVESHIHLFSGGAGLTQLQLKGVAGREALAAALTAYAATKPAERLLICQGAAYNLLGEHIRLDRHRLDAILSERPVIVMAYDFHTAWANTAALEQAGLLQGRDVGDGNEVVLGADGLATGELREKNAFLPVLGLRSSGGREMLGMTGTEPHPPATAQERADDIAMITAGLQHCAAAGITTIHNMDGNRYTLELLSQIEAAGGLLCRVEVPFHLTAEKPLASLDDAVQMAADYKSDMLKSGRVKVFCDGVIESGTALFLDDYADRPGWKGEALFGPEKFRQAAIEIDRRGLQISVHAIGDGAVRLVLDGYEAAELANGRRDSRHRIEHVEVIHPDDVPRFAALGVIASMQPLHPPGTLGSPLEPGVSRIGPARAPLAYAWRSLIEAGAPYAFSSDWPVVPVEPLLSLQASQARQPWSADLPDQRVSLMQVLEGYTWRGAHAGFMEDRIGRIVPGFLADLVLLRGDIEATATADMPGLGPQMTICNGQVTFET